MADNLFSPACRGSGLLKSQAKLAMFFRQTIFHLPIPKIIIFAVAFAIAEE
jgi:hypothetical protein